MFGHTRSAAANLLFLLAFVFGTIPALASGDLYRAKTIVTGQREESRLPGFSKCLQDVLVKVSGDPKLIGDPAATGVLARAPEFVSGYRYRDRLEGLPIHDEQGSRDRPYDLTADFDPEKVDAALRALGREPWTAPRPTVSIFLSVQNDTTTYLLASDGSNGIDQRESLVAAAWQMGMPMVLPGQAALNEAGLTFESLAAARIRDLEKLASASGGNLPLLGRLVWSKGTLGWMAEWRLAWNGRTYHWWIRDVNFDDAFRSAMRGAAQIVSGNANQTKEQHGAGGGT